MKKLYLVFFNAKVKRKKTTPESKRLKVSGLKDELVDRLEKADRGQTQLLFHIPVPQGPEVQNELPRTPQRRKLS